MTVYRSPRLAAIRRREDEADRKRVAIIVSSASFIAASLVVLGIASKVFQ